MELLSQSFWSLFRPEQHCYLALRNAPVPADLNLFDEDRPMYRAILAWNTLAFAVAMAALRAKCGFVPRTGCGQTVVWPEQACRRRPLIDWQYR